MSFAPVVPVSEILPEIDTSGLATLDEIAAGYQHNSDSLMFQVRCVNAEWDEWIVPKDSMAFANDLAYWLRNPDCDYDKKTYPPIFEAFRGQLIVDLGAGGNIGGFELASIAGAKGYVGVEPIHAQELYQALSDEKVVEEMIKENGLQELVPRTVVASDMLSFLKLLKDETVSVTAHGISNDIIDDEDYASEVEREIMRVVVPGGYFLSHCSRFGHLRWAYNPPECFFNELQFGESDYLLRKD